MAKRVVLAGLLGGLVIFLWGSLSHMVLGLGQVGIKGIPNEDAVLSAMRATIQQPGFYFFPSLGLSPNAPREQRAAAMEAIEKKAASGPSGILIYRPSGGLAFTPGRLGTELVLNVIQALLAAILASRALGGYASRVGFVTTAGLLGSLGTNIQYWNWYGFPSNYTVASIANQVTGFFLAGLVVAAIVKSGTDANDRVAVAVGRAA